MSGKITHRRLTSFGFHFFFALAVLAVVLPTAAHSAQVTVGWNSCSTTNITGYKLYYGLSSGNYTYPVRDAGNTLSYAIPDNLTASACYLAVTAYNSTSEGAKSPELVIYSTTASAGTGGSISPSGTFYAGQGSNQTFTITPNAGYQVAGVTVDGSSVGAVNTYTLSNVGAAHTVSATFAAAPTTYTITASAGANGSISPSPSATVNSGASQTFTITPNTGYKVATVTVDGTALSSPVTTYTFSNVTANHSISATFAAVAPSTYTITSSAGANGSISPSPSATVNSGGSQTFTITPNTGYKVATVTVDGTAQSSPVTTYTFSNVTANHSISATFTLANNFTITSSAGANGSITPSGTVSVNSGASQAFTMTANANYHIADVVVDSVHLGPQATPYTYTFNNVNASHTISVLFGRVVNVSSTAQLISAFSGQQQGDEIVIAPGTYTLSSPLAGISVNNLYIHGSTANRADVTIVGDAMSSSAAVNYIFYFPQGAYGQYTTIANLSAGKVGWSVVQQNGDEGGDYSTFTNVRFFDAYEQLLKGSIVTTGWTGLTVQGCLFEYTASNHLGPQYYIGGVDIHGAVNCTIQDNTLRYIQSPDGANLPDPAIHIWDANKPNTGNIIQRNLIVDCDRGIAIWQPSGSPANGGIIRNNMIYNSGTGTINDVAIYLEYAPNTQIYNNTVYYAASYPNAIEYRYSATTGVLIENNLSNKAILARDSATGTVSNNVISAQSSWFVSPSTGDLHLASAVSSVAGKGIAVSGLTDDIDKQARGSSIDIGADQYTASTSYTITVTQGSNGAIAPSTTTVTSGGSQTFTITPNAGYKVATVTVDGTALSNPVSTYTFSNVTANHSISATFAANTYTITSSAGANGSISPAPSATVNSGGSQTFTITPNSGYTVAGVTVDGAALSSPVTTYTFSNVTANHSISATFAAVTYTITASAGANGSISPSPSATVNSGGSQTFTITPNTGYKVAGVTVDGTALSSPVTSYTFSNVTANHSISATFAAIPVTYTITSSAGANGSISPSPSVTVNSGANQTFTITPNTGYKVATVTVDGTALSSPTTSYTFSNVTANHSIAATFTLVNQPPVADAGPTQTVPEGTLVTLNGSNSSDPGNSPLTYKWTQTAGPTVTLSSQTAVKPTFTAPNVETAGAALTFQLTVTNQLGLQSSATCIVNVTWVNAPPTANAGSNLTVAEGAAVTLDGCNSTDPDDGIASYAWKQTAGPAVTLTTTTPTQAVFIAPNVGQTGTSLTFQLTVTDKGGLQSSATCVVNDTWVNSPPQANAGQDQTVYGGNVVVLDGSASSDSDDGIKSYLWTQTSGTPVTLSSPTSAQPYFTAPAVGASGATLTFQLTVTDNGGLQSTDTCNVNVQQKTAIDLTGSWKSLSRSGSRLSASFTIKNIGNQNAGSFVTKFYLSSDGKTLGNLITQKSLSSLNAAQSNTVSFSYYASGLSGKYVIAVVDANNSVTESNEQNNNIPVVIP